MTAKNQPIRILKRLFSIREAAAYLGISTWRVRQLVADGRIPHRRVGADFDPEYFHNGTRKKGSVRIEKADLDAYADSSPLYGKNE